MARAISSEIRDRSFGTLVWFRKKVDRLMVVQPPNKKAI